GCAGPDGPIRVFPGLFKVAPPGGPLQAAGSLAHGSLLRSLPKLRRADSRRCRRTNLGGEDPMIDIFEKGSYRVAVHEPVDAEQLEPQQVLALCAAGARNGSGDPIDLALVHSATSRGQAIPFEQGSWSGPSPERPYSLVQLRRVIDDCELRVARGDLDSILALTVASDQRRERSHQALASLETEGFAGIVPVRVTRARTSMKDSPTDFLYIQVWDWQLRVLHWTWVILIAVLAVTG